MSAVEFLETWEHDHPLTWHLAEAIFTECESKARQGLLYSETAATLLALQVVRNLSNRRNSTNLLSRGGLAPASLRRVCDYMVDRMSDDISLTELASISGLSVGHFAFAFKQSMGVAPHRFQIQRRVERAKAMLADDRRSVTEIALSCGFGCSSNFASTFRKLTGRTPSGYRKSLT